MAEIPNKLNLDQSSHTKHSATEMSRYMHQSFRPVLDSHQAEIQAKQQYLKKSAARDRECKTSSPVLLVQGFVSHSQKKQIQSSMVTKQQSPDTLHQSITKALLNSKTKSSRDMHTVVQSNTQANKSIKDFTEICGLRTNIRNDEPKFDILSVFVIFGISIEDRVAAHHGQVQDILLQMARSDNQDQTVNAAKHQLYKVLNAGNGESVKPRILGFVDKHTQSDYSKQDLTFLKSNYPFTAAFQHIAVPSGTLPEEADMNRIKIITNIEDKRQFLNELNKKNAYSTFISTDSKAKRDFVQTLRFKRLKCLSLEGEQVNRRSILIKYTCSMHVVSAQSQSLIQTMTNFLNFTHHTTYAKQNEQEIDKFLGKQEGSSTLEEKLMRHGPEFICNVMFNHVHFQKSVLSHISLQFPKVALKPQIPEMSFRNAYLNSCEFKIEDFNFRYLFEQIGDIDKVMQLIRALLLEKKVIFIKDDVSDVAILMQTLIVLLAPFKWCYSLITDLPTNLIEALESPQPFFVAIQKNIWNKLCQVQMMDNVQQDNFVIFDIDENKTRGLTDIYDLTSEINANISLSNNVKRKYQQLVDLKGTLIEQLTTGGENQEQTKFYSDEKAQELYWVWFQLKIKQAMYQLYLNMIGNIQAGFKTKQELYKFEQKKGGYKNLSGHDIFDFKKYLQILKDEDSENLNFMTALVEKQCFVTLIEDLYQSMHEYEKCSCYNCIFYSSLQYLVNHSSKPKDSYITFEDKVEKRLRNNQNQKADKIYLTYKNQIPFKFTYILEEYYKRVCKKDGLTVSDDAGCKEQVGKLLQRINKEEPQDQEQKPFNNIKENLLTEMKGIDYTKIQQYLNFLEQKKKIKLLKQHQGSKNGTQRDNLSSPQEAVSESDSKLHFNNFTQMTMLNRSTSKLGGHKRINSSNTENVLNTTKQSQSKSLRRENVASQSYQLPQKNTESDSLQLQRSPTIKTRNDMYSSNNKNTLSNQSMNQNEISYSQFLTGQQSKAQINPKITTSMDNLQTSSIQSLLKFKKNMLSNQKTSDNAENLYQKVNHKQTNAELRDPVRFQLSRQSNQSSIQNMKPPQNPLMSSPYKLKGIQLQKNYFQVPNSCRLKGTMSTLSLGLRSGNGSDKISQEPIKSGITFQTHSNENKQSLQDVTQKNLASSLELGRKSAQQLEHCNTSKLASKRVNNQSEQTVQQPMILTSPPQNLLYQTKMIVQTLQYQTKMVSQTTGMITKHNSVFNSRNHSKAHLNVQTTKNNEVRNHPTQVGPSKSIPNTQPQIKNRTRNVIGQKVAITQQNINKTVASLKSKTNRNTMDKSMIFGKTRKIQVPQPQQLVKSNTLTTKRKTVVMTSLVIPSMKVKSTLVHANTLTTQKVNDKKSEESNGNEEEDFSLRDSITSKSVQKIPKTQRFNSFTQKRPTVQKTTSEGVEREKSSLNSMQTGKNEQQKVPLIQITKSFVIGSAGIIRRPPSVLTTSVTSEQLKQDKNIRLKFGSPTSKNGVGKLHERKPSNRYNDKRESILSDIIQTKAKAPVVARTNKMPNRNSRYDIEKEDSILQPVINTNGVYQQQQTNSTLSLQVPLNSINNEAKDEDIIDTNRGDYDTAQKRLSQNKQNMKTLIESHIYLNNKQLQSPQQWPESNHNIPTDHEEGNNPTVANHMHHLTVNNSYKKKLPKMNQNAYDASLDQNQMLSPTIFQQEQHSYGKMTQYDPTSSNKLFSPAHLKNNTKTPSYRKAGALAVDHGDHDASIVSTSKIHRVSMSSNKNQLKKYLKQKIKVQKIEFNTSERSIIAFGQKLQNRLSTKLAFKKEEVEETIDNSEDMKSGVKQSEISYHSKQQAVVLENSEDSENESIAHDEQHPYQLDQVMIKMSQSHKKSKSIFSNENHVITAKVSGESLEKTLTDHKPRNVDPSGEQRIDFQRMYQQHQLRVSSHGGDIDNEPWTPRTNNLDSSGKAQTSSKHKKSGSDKKGQPSSQGDSLQGGSSGRHTYRQIKQKALYQKLSQENLVD